MQWRAIKQAGGSVQWRCSYVDIARETGLHQHTVGKICRRNGWECQNDDGRRETGNLNSLAAEGIDVMMRLSLDRPECHV